MMLSPMSASPDVGELARGVIGVRTDEHIDARPSHSLLLTWSSWERGATSTLPVQLRIPLQAEH